MKVSFIVPNFNGEEILHKNLPRVLEAAELYGEAIQHFTEVIVIDDCSTDRSVTVIESIFSKKMSKHVKCLLLKNSVNKGFSSTVNKGARQATGEILVLLNTDAYPEDTKNFLVSPLGYFSDPNCFAVGFMDKSVEQDGSIVMRGRGVGCWKRGVLVHIKGNVSKQNTLWVSGGSSAYRKTTWDTLGGMNEIYNPFYWEDIDLSYRALKSGYSIIFDPKCVVVHEHERGAIKRSRSRFTVQTIAHRNQLFFVWLNLTDPALLIAHILWLPYHILNTLRQGDCTFLIGFFQAVMRLPEILRLKGHNSAQFVLSDGQVVSEFTSEVR
ncbi:MAG: glycosyltransferase family 2 protein [bacterium]|nr:glycosyltransferase family 2 protein [bacterium]